MSSLLEITGEDITLLDDADLRTLIGLLCEADYRSVELPTKGITWSGHQDAPDGGLDVVVRGEIDPPVNSFIPRKITGFQVRKYDMPRSLIIKEMKPKGVLREVIKSFIQENGAYIIVSSAASTTDPTLKNRLSAMQDTVRGEDGYENLHLDFLDRGRIATWVRSHPSLILWIRNKIGRPLTGWQPFENWSKSPGGIEEEYILDDGLRLYDGTDSSNEKLSVESGMQKIRSLLSAPGSSIRLAGLSGVGKTRFIQALFDDRIGQSTLNPSLAFYTDMANGPDPNPVAFVEQLIALKTRAILIIDNCPPDLHSRAVKIRSGLQDTISLLTAEYDVRDHLPEETSVFKLEPCGDEVIKKLLKNRFPHISQIDINTISNFSGGNARVAILLANTVKQGETLSGFRDDVLFERLFQQRHETSENLLISAQVCSLVYSFEGTDTDSERSELKFLASLAGKSVLELYRDVSTLKDRDLIQSRSVWRALLPLAIANRLAKRTLESIPIDSLTQSFLCNSSERLIKSFTHRLHYLHDSKVAVKMANDWLAEEGWLGKAVCNFNQFGMEVFRNIAPVTPGKVLETIERAANGGEGDKFTSRENRHYHEFVLLLRHLAYDPVLFSRCIDLICRFALSEKPDENNNSTRNILESLFFIYMSGTHATAEQRAKEIEKLLFTDDRDRQELGLFLLNAALETWDFSSSYGFEFGARSRDFGFSPKTREDIENWYEIFINLCTRLALSDQKVFNSASKILADHLQGLWTELAMYKIIEYSAGQIHTQKTWNEGWLSICRIIRYDGKGFNEEILQRLYKLEQFLKPNNLLERARAFALSDQNYAFDLENTFDENNDELDGWQRVREITHKIGTQIAQDLGSFTLLLPELISSNSDRVHTFCRGIAEGCRNKNEYWEYLYNEFENTPKEKRQIRVFEGFLSYCAENDPEFYNGILDNIIRDPLLGEWFPILQATSKIDKRGVERLLDALEKGKAPVNNYRFLAWGSVHESVSEDDLSIVLEKILSMPEGVYVAIEILTMKFHGAEKKFCEHSRKLIEIAREALSQYPFSNRRRYTNNTDDYRLSRIVEECLQGNEAEIAAFKICRNFIKGLEENRIYKHDFPGLLNALSNTQPIVFLDVFCEETNLEDYQFRRFFSDFPKRQKNPMDQINDDIIISWCNQKPQGRYPIIASVVTAFSESEETGTYEWKPIVHKIIEKAPQINLVLESLMKTIKPIARTGSRAELMENRSVLLTDLFDHDNTEVRTWAKNEYLLLKAKIQKEREEERVHSRERNESFE